MRDAYIQSGKGVAFVNESIERLRRQIKYRQIRRIESMPPGRRLDALVARHVMGYLVEERPDPAGDGTDFWYLPQGSRFRQLEGMDEPERVPNYSTAVHPALQVLDRFPLWKLEGIGSGGGISALVSRNPGHGIWIRGCRTLPEAICKAALIAVVEDSRIVDELMEGEE